MNANDTAARTALILCPFSMVLGETKIAGYDAVRGRHSETSVRGGLDAELAAYRARVEGKIR